VGIVVEDIRDDDSPDYCAGGESQSVPKERGNSKRTSYEISDEDSDNDDDGDDLADDLEDGVRERSSILESEMEVVAVGMGVHL
jgi:hypothetical protein